MLKNAGKSSRILFTPIIPRALIFSAFSRDLLHGLSMGFKSVMQGAFRILFVSKQPVLSFVFLFRFRFHRLSENKSQMLSQRLVSLLPMSTSFALLRKRKRGPRVISGRTRRQVFYFFLSCRATIGYFN